MKHPLVLPLRRPSLHLFALASWILASAPSTRAAVTNVNIIDFAFSPRMVAISVNDQVKWTWTGSAPHTTTSDTGLWDSGITGHGSSFTNTFSTAGNFPYHCDVHPFMTGSVAVESANAPPSINTQPQSQTVIAGHNATFTVSARGTSPLIYQWRFNGNPIADATDTALTLNNVQPMNAGTYSMLVTNDFGMTVSSDAVLTVTAPKGAYAGLFFNPDNVTFQISGNFTLATTGTAKFTGKLQMGNRRLSMKGQFDVAGNATNTIMQANQSPVTVILHLDPADADRVTGTVSDGTTTVPLAGDRVVFDGRQNLAPQAGQYTMIISGDANSASLPGGDSYGAVTVDTSGKIHLSGSLADGTKIIQMTTVSKNGDWPFYVPLYGNLGSILGWLSFVNGSTNDLRGDVVWFKPNLATVKFYPAGFNFTTTASGFKYHPPAPGTAALNFTNGIVALTGGDLAGSITNLIAIDTKNHVTNLSSNRLTVVFKSTTGTFTGRVTVPNTTQSLPFSGVLLQTLGIGQGYFLGTTQSGQALISP